MGHLILHRMLPALDRVGQALAGLAALQVLALIGVMLFEVVARRFFGAPTIWAVDVTYMTNGTLFLMGAAYTLALNGHVRIDFLATRLPVRFQHLVNLAFYLIIFLPALGLTSYHSVLKAHRAWARGTLENMSTWEPVVWPFLTGIALGVLGLTLQVALQAIRHGYGVVAPDLVPAPSAIRARR